MTEHNRPLDYIQPQITVFKQDVNLRVQMKEELGKMLKLMVQWHLEEFVRLYLKLKKNPVTLGEFIAYVTDALPRMENKEICYLKTMPEGRVYMFKRAYCYYSDETWRKCPHFRCLVKFQCCDLPCPYGPDYYADPFEVLSEDEKAALAAYKRHVDEENCGKQN